jgi:WD40 repeat protein
LQLRTHGDLENQIVVWKYPGLTQLASLTRHSSGVLYTVVAPDGEAVVTGGGDETPFLECLQQKLVHRRNHEF